MRLPVLYANAVVYERAVVIEIGHTSVAYSTMFGSEGAETPARVAQPRQEDFALFQLVVVRNLKIIMKV